MSAPQTVARERARQRSDLPVLFSMDDLIGGTPFADELQNINRGKQLVQIQATGDQKGVSGQVAAALKDMSSDQIVFLSCRIRTTERNAEDHELPPHALVRDLVVIAKAKTVRDHIDDVLAGRLSLLDTYLVLNFGEYREDKNLHVYWIGLSESLRKTVGARRVFDNLTRILQKKYGGYSYTSHLQSEEIERLHETKGLVPVDIDIVQNSEERAKAKRLIARVHEYEFVAENTSVAYGLIPRYSVSPEESERRRLLEEQARRYGLAVNIEEKTVNGKTIREWAKSLDLMVAYVSNIESTLGDELRDKMTQYRYFARIEKVEEYILTYARSIGEEKKTQKWINDLKASAGKLGRDQKEYITGLDGPHKLKKSLSPLEWALRGDYDRKLAKAKQEKLFGVYPVEGSRVEELPLWPVDENGRLIEGLIAWMSTPGAPPPPRYFAAKKVALLDLVPQQLTLDFSSRQIGKRAQMESVSGHKARVVDSQSNLHYLDLEPQGKIAVDVIKSRLEKMKGISDPHKNLLLLFLGLLEKSPPEKRPELCTFRDFVEDLYGFASADQKIIALHDYLSDNPVAIFHEIGEYLVGTGGIHLFLFGNKLVIEGPAQQRLGELSLSPDAMYQASKGKQDPHYLLRAMQREIFGSLDRALTEKIKFIGNIEIESKRAGMDDVDSLLKELIVKTDDFERIISEVVREKIKISDLSGRIKIASFAEGSNKKVYKVTFYTKDNKALDAVVALKKEKGLGRIPQSEIEDLRWLSTAKRKVMELVPVFGFTFTAKDGREMYVEQFIEGNTVEDYRAEGTLTWDLKKKIISNLFTIGIMLGNQYPKDVHERNFIITPDNKVVMIDIGNKRFSIPETLRNGDYKTMAEFIFLIIVHYSQEGEDSYIRRALFQSLEDANGFLKKNNTQVLRAKKTMGEVRTEIIRFLDGTRRYLMNLNESEREKLVGSLMASTYMRGYFKQHDVPENDRRSFVANNLSRVMTLLRIENVPSPEGVDLFPPSQIGKRAFVESISNEIAWVKDAQGNVKQVPLSGAGPVPYKQIKSQIERMADVDERYRQMLLEMISLLEKSPPEIQPRLYTFTRLVEDLFGIASPQHNMIALHADFVSNPVALVHEILEYVKDVYPQTMLQIESSLGLAARIWLTQHERKYSDMNLADYFNQNKTHFVIRAFARQTFRNRDVALTQSIKNMYAAQTALAQAEEKARTAAQAARLQSLAAVHETFYNAVVAALTESGIKADEKQKRMDAAFETLLQAIDGEAKKRLYRRKYAEFLRALKANGEMLSRYKNDWERKQALVRSAAEKLGYEANEDLDVFREAATYEELLPGVPVIKMEYFEFLDFIKPYVSRKNIGAIAFAQPNEPSFILQRAMPGEKVDKVLSLTLKHELQHLLHYFLYRAGLRDAEIDKLTEEQKAFGKFKNELCSYILGYAMQSPSAVSARYLTYSDDQKILDTAGATRDFVDLCIKLAGAEGIPPTRFIYPILASRNFDDIKEKCFSMVTAPRAPSKEVSDVFERAVRDKKQAYLFVPDQNIIQFLPEALKEFIARLQGVYTDQVMRSFYDEILSRKHTYITQSDIAKSIFGSQIGKKALVESVGNDVARVKGQTGEETEVPLDGGGALDVAALRQQLAAMVKPQHQQSLGLVLSLLQTSPPEKYTYDILVDDLFGFAASPKMIALHNSIAASPIALFHEACELLIQTNGMKLALEGEQLSISLSSGEHMLVPLDPESLAIAGKDPANQHYLLRALARTLFARQDAQLTRDIKTVQRIKALEEKAVLGDVTSNRLFGKIAIDADTGPEATRAALKAIENVINTEDLGTLAYAECATDIRMIISVKPLFIEPSTVVALEKILSRELGVAAYEDAAAAVREIALARKELIRRETVDVLIAMIKERGVQPYNPAASILSTLKEIMSARPEFIDHPELLEAVRGVFNNQNLRPDICGSAVSLLRVIAQQKSALIDSPDIKNVKKIIADKLFMIDGYREAALFLRAVNEKLPQFAQEARQIVKKLLEKNEAPDAIQDAVKRSFYNGTIAHMGKRGQVSAIVDASGKRYAQIVNRNNGTDVLGTVELVPQKNTRNKLERALTTLSRYAQPRSRVMEEFLKVLQTSPALKSLSFFTFDPFVEDVFGFASPQHAIAALYEPFKNDTVALFHEFAEYLIGIGLLDLELEDGKFLQISFRANPYEPFEVKSTMLINDDTRRFIEHREGWDVVGEGEWRKNDHYLLRVLQRQLFQEKDRNLTAKIQNLQDVQQFHRLACEGDHNAIDRLILIAYNLQSEQIVSKKALEALEQVLLTDGLTDAVYDDAAAGIRVVAINRLKTINASTMQALERCLRRRPAGSFLVSEAVSGLREIVYFNPDLIGDSTIETLMGILVSDTFNPDVYTVCASVVMYIARQRPSLISPALYMVLEKHLRDKDRDSAENVGMFLGKIVESCPQLREKLTGNGLRSFLWFRLGLPYVQSFYDEYMKAADPKAYIDTLVAQNDRYIDHAALEQMIDECVVDQDKKYSNMTVLLGRPFSKEMCNKIDMLNRDLKRACPEGVLQTGRPEACHTSVIAAGRVVQDFIPENASKKLKEGLVALLGGIGSIEGALRGTLRLTPNGVVILEMTDPQIIAQVERIRDAVSSQEAYRKWYRPKIVHITLCRLKTTEFTPEQILKIRDVLNRWNQSGPFVKGIPVAIDTVQFGLFSPMGDKVYYASELDLARKIETASLEEQKVVLSERLSGFSSALSAIQHDGRWISGGAGMEPAAYIFAVINQAKKDGHQAVELYLEDIIGGLSDSDMPAKLKELDTRYVNEIRKAASDAGIHLIVHLWAKTFVSRDNVIRYPDPKRDESIFTAGLDFARDIGAKDVTIHMVDPSEAETYVSFVKAAAKYGITVGIEHALYNRGKYANMQAFYNESVLHDAAAFIQALRRINARLTPREQKYLGVTFDLPRAKRVGDAIAYYRTIRDAGIRIANIHIAQTDIDTYTKRPMYEPGAIKMVEFFDLLAADRYDGFINQELLGPVLPPRPAEKLYVPSVDNVGTEAIFDVAA